MIDAVRANLRILPALVFAVCVLVALSCTSIVATLIVLSDGLIALGVFVAALGIGRPILWAIGLRPDEPRWVIIPSIGLGLGILSLALLGFGSLGLLQRGLWMGVIGVGAVAGALQLLPYLRTTADDSMNRCATRGVWASRPHESQSNPLENTTADGPPRNRLIWLWLLAAPFAYLALLLATMPPGTLWPAEGNGYDVLEYHLACPREFFDAGQIKYLSHNIYSNFPFNVEMLYLLSMVLRGDPIEGAFTAQMLNVGFAMLAVAATWLAAREFGRAGGIVAGLAVATCPFVTYLCGLAYVENGLLAFSALALAAWIRAMRQAECARLRWMLASGAMAGLACGCKYTGVYATALPLCLTALWPIRHHGAAASSNESRPRAARSPSAIARASVFAIGCAITFAPWLVRNVINTGNPVFPLARSVFHERGGIWTDEAAARWHEGHLPAPEDRAIDARLRRLNTEFFQSELLHGPVLIGILGAGLLICIRWITRPRRQLITRGGRATRDHPPTAAFDSPDAMPGAVACIAMIAIGLAVWTGATHLVGRFAIVLIVPSAVLFGLLVAALRQSTAQLLAVVAISALAAVGGKTLTSFVSSSTKTGLAIFQLGAFGASDWFTSGQWPGHAYVPVLNEITADGGRILVVGDAKRFYLDPGVDYCVVFNRNPFAEAAATMSPAELAGWLRDRRYGYVYVDWSEMRRLRNSRYGFWPSVDEALFRRLVDAGAIQPVREFRFEEMGRPYATLFRVGA